MTKVLAIGNSFSQDALFYIHEMGKASGYDVKVVNLYIGGCSLEAHWRNIEANARAYQYQVNGMITERTVSIEEVIKEERWDIIVTQQASYDSGWMVTYEPFLGLILDYLRDNSCGSQIVLHETWAYEVNSSHNAYMRYNRNQQVMYERLHECYTTMAKKYGVPLIPSGSIIHRVRQLPEFDVSKGGVSLCRDGFHMSFSYGRYLLAYIWLRALFKIQVNSEYVPNSILLENTPDKQLLAKLRETVEKYL